MSVAAEVTVLPDEHHGRSYRVTPKVWIGLAVYAGYLAIFYTTWAVNHVDYEHIGDTTESAKLHYALPTLLGCAFLVVVVTALGWWRPALFDRQRSGPRWAWIGPVAFAVLGVAGYATLNADNVSSELILWAVLGGIGVGFGEEMITRGTMVVGLRSRFAEGHVWLFSTQLFSALHIPNVFFGLRPVAVPNQLVMTFIVGSLLYATRRLSGTLLLPMVLHGVWDSSIFTPRATGGEAMPIQLLIYPIAILCAYAVIRRNWTQRIAP